MARSSPVDRAGQHCKYAPNCLSSHYLPILYSICIFICSNSYSRGQLGHGDLNSVDVTCPRRVEALAPVRVLDAAAGGWHTLCCTGIDKYKIETRVSDELRDSYSCSWPFVFDCVVQCTLETECVFSVRRRRCVFVRLERKRAARRPLRPLSGLRE